MRNILICVGLILGFSANTRSEEIPIWIGTGSRDAAGIYLVKLNTDSGKLSQPMVAGEIGGAGFLAKSKDGKFLYSLCSEEKGSVAAFRIKDDHTLELINTMPTGDGGAAHLAVDDAGKILLSAQYGGGSVTSYALRADGGIDRVTATFEHEGSGPNPQRQKAPHPHWIGFSPDQSYAFCPDLGIDQIVVYQVDHETQALVETERRGITIPGGGPRHMKFDPAGAQVYLLNELIPSVTRFGYDAETGALEQIDTIKSLSDEAIASELRVTASEIRFHPSGKFLYSANRGHDSITAYAVAEDGSLSVVEVEPVRGAWPRNFNLDPSGKWLVAAGRHTNTLTVFAVDQETGALTYSAVAANVPAPICVEF
ncbi:MAG: lactonase family protein [Verrucomicrobiota bacterium]